MGCGWKPPLPFCRMVGTVCNSVDAVRLETAPTGGESAVRNCTYLDNSPIYRAYRGGDAPLTLPSVYPPYPPASGGKGFDRSAA